MRSVISGLRMIGFLTLRCCVGVLVCWCAVAQCDIEGYEWAPMLSAFKLISLGQLTIDQISMELHDTAPGSFFGVSRCCDATAVFRIPAKPTLWWFASLVLCPFNLVCISIFRFACFCLEYD